MGLIYNKLMKILESQGVKTFDSLGKPFDPYYHDALLQVPKNDIPPHTVIEEVEKGYLLHDKVIRHAKVIVSGEAKSSEEISKTTGQLEPGENKGEVRTN
jgi:molecular chaperone GrpE